MKKKRLQFTRHYLESTSPSLRKLHDRYNTNDHKTNVWNTFIDADLTEVYGDDCAIFPRVLPASYLPVIKKTAKEVTTFALRLLSLPEEEVKAIIPRGPIRDFLINELGVLRHRNGRITGSFRFDMAVVDPPLPDNPPKLLEINEIGFDGLARSSYIQKTLLDLIPELRTRVVALDTAAAEIRNMQRLGRNIARIQYDSYNWDEEYLIKTAERLGSTLRLVCPAQFKLGVDRDESPLLHEDHVEFGHDGRVQIVSGQSSSRTGPRKDAWRPEAVQLSYAFELEDYLAGRRLYADLVKSKTPQYGPFLTGLVAAKMILVLLDDKSLRKKLLGKTQFMEDSILPSYPLEGNLEKVVARPHKLVLKHTDGYGGKQVFMGNELSRQLKKIKPSEHYEWVVQERTRLNLLNVNGILSRPRRVISDLGVFVHYDWKNGKFDNFEVGGFITRATNTSLKVNVSGGGIQVPVMFERGR